MIQGLIHWALSKHYCIKYGRLLPFPSVFSHSHHTISISLCSFLLLLFSVYLPPSSHLSLNSCSQVSFSCYQIPFSLCPFTSFPLLMQIRDTCMSVYTHKTYTCMEMIKSQDVYCAWTDTRLEPEHRCAVFRLKLWIASRPEMKTHYIGHFTLSLAYCHGLVGTWIFFCKCKLFEN